MLITLLIDASRFYERFLICHFLFQTFSLKNTYEINLQLRNEISIKSNIG